MGCRDTMEEALLSLTSPGPAPTDGRLEEALEWECVSSAAGVVGGGGGRSRPPRPPVLEAEEDVRLAYVWACPFVYTRRDGSVSAVPSIDAGAELALVRSALVSANKRVRFVAEVATAQQIRRLMTLGCDFLHYSGHGVSDGLALEADRGADVHVVSHEALCALIGAGGEVRTRFVFVSACHSEPAGRAFVDAGVPHVVAVKQEAKVSDAASRTFARQFYLALLVGKTVRQAFEIGSRSASVEQPPGQSSGAKFLLLPEDGDHEVQMVRRNAVADGAFVDETRPPSPCTAAMAPRPFVGRARELADAARFLASGARCVSVVGPQGMGKSALAAKIAEYVARRRSYDAVAAADLDGDAPLDAAVLHACARVAEARGRPFDPKGGKTPLVDALAAAAGGGGDGKVLVVLDCARQRSSADVVAAMSSILLRTRSVSFLVVAERSLHASSNERLRNEGEKVVELAALDRRSAAVLLVQLAPRRLLRHETGGADGGLDGLANHAVVGALRGLPRAIADFAPSLQNLFLDRDGAALLRLARDAAGADDPLPPPPPPPPRPSRAAPRVALAAARSRAASPTAPARCRRRLPIIAAEADGTTAATATGRAARSRNPTPPTTITAPSEAAAPSATSPASS